MHTQLQADAVDGYVLEEDLVCIVASTTQSVPALNQQESYPWRIGQK